MNVKKILQTEFRYPFPCFKNPYADTLQHITDNEWIDGTYLYLYKEDETIRKKYKKTRTAHIASHWFPTARQERFRAVCLLMLWTLYNDDMYEEITPEVLPFVRDRSLAVLSGEAAGETSGIPLGPLLASLREELLQHISPASYKRFVAMIARYFNGLEKELVYKADHRYPDIGECLAIREDSLCLYPFLQLTEIDTGIALPDEIHEHQVIKRLQALASRMMLLYNDVQSLVKDELTGGVYYNLVKVIENKKNISLEAACAEDIRMHNEDLKEFLMLQRNLPDFGEWQGAVVNWVHYISITLSGWKTVSFDLARYNTTTGFPSVESIKTRA
ncbi:terpene synthase family protein [Sinomicrobium kalidii]|uniref:terpene synthase family protein n=1 Tax=Sinomicrobium kalidii TaxID=2900738 RepID=UPI001E611899|nr:terpene synthase family protein [Sinomicrobium kalidii]UGU17847.1 terpene synthase family protein [Sinomicrobium kalidii]